MDVNNSSNLLELYMEIAEKQDEIIFHLTQLVKEYRMKLNEFKAINEFFDLSDIGHNEEELLKECMEQYNDMK